MENTPFGGFSAGLRRPNQLAAVGGFWFSADWPLYSPNLNSLDFSTSSVLWPKGQAMPHANFAAPKHAALSAAAVKLLLRKMKLKLNGWLAKDPAYTDQYFSG
jgi:hypothetical protein